MPVFARDVAALVEAVSAQLSSTPSYVLLLDRSGRVLAFAPVAGAPWEVAFLEPERGVFASTRQLRNRIYLTGGLALLLVGAFSWLGVQRVVRHLEQLTEASRRVSGGDLDTPFPSGPGAGRRRLRDQALWPMELIARIRAVLRRSKASLVGAGAPQFQRGDLTVDFSTHEAGVAGRRAKLRPRESKLLERLVPR